MTWRAIIARPYTTARPASNLNPNANLNKMHDTSPNRESMEVPPGPAESEDELTEESESDEEYETALGGGGGGRGSTDVADPVADATMQKILSSARSRAWGRHCSPRCPYDTPMTPL